MYQKIVVSILVLFSESLAMHSSKALEGYPAGYLADCPGTNVPGEIQDRRLKYLTITVQGRNPFTLVKRSYTYYQTRELSKDPDLDFRKKTLLYVGGYMDTPYLPFAMIAGLVYKKIGYNVLLLDTSSFTRVEYPIAARNMRTIGKRVAEMLVDLTKNGLDPNKLEFLGLSLGAHTMGFIAKNYRNMTGMTISRATAMDPAGPCFRNLGPEDRLDQTDADFVDVIDTNIDGYGMAAPIGHVNFYVNGGEFQPGDVLWMPCNVFCSHLRSFTLWMAAIQYNDKFIALKCDSVQDARNKDCFDRVPLETNVVGLNIDRTKQGVFYLATQNNYPYFLGEMGLRKENEFFDMQVNLFRRRKFV